jgi:uncharacterized protein involved in exopolysaccharide biosynthesis
VGTRRRGLALLAALGVVFAAAAPALAAPPESSIRGTITEVSRSAKVVLVEEDPASQSGLAKGEFAVTDETEILEQRGEDLVPVPFEKLRVGQKVEAMYAGPVAESYPTQGVAARIVILDTEQSDALTVLPDTGGGMLLVSSVLLIGGALLVRRVAGYSLR